MITSSPFILLMFITISADHYNILSKTMGHFDLITKSECYSGAINLILKHVILYTGHMC